ncbi:MAG TPA: type II CAAX endopeptidase family protein [Acidobacteriota bacterium]|nr:type II CAAX endopeptidase family protein [Acidobacteriota bacterium]
MSFAKKTGIGPAIRVLRHFVERRRFYQLKFSSGEQALVLIADMPAPSVELVRLIVGGLVPWQTVWEYNPARAGGYSDYIDKLKKMFSPTTGRFDDAYHYIRDTLLRCRSIEEACTLLFERERQANGSTANAAVESPKYSPRSIMHDDAWELGTNNSPRVPVSEKPRISGLPDRYRIRKDDRDSVLTCVEAPMVMVRAKRGEALSAKQARNYPAGAIFLDGAAQGEPFVDVKMDLYNLNHPEECVQHLATCEQALVLIRKGLDLRKRDWVVLVNDADLDTIFAVWVILNNFRLNADAEVRAKLMPLLRLEGVIDAHGLDSQDLTALPPDLLSSTAAIRKKLQQQEAVLKHYGRWSELDLLDYLADRLRAIDEVIYPPEQFVGLEEVNELARTEIANGSVAVVCSSDAGADEVERQLQKMYGRRLGLWIYQNTSSTYTLRQVDRNLPASLKGAYERLNLLDPAVSSGPENRWGGSTEMGYSPRKTGTSLSPAQIIDAIRETFWQPSLFDAVSQVPRALYLAGGALLPALALIFIGNLLRDRGYITAASTPLAALVIAITVVILFSTKARLVPGLYGWRIPTGSGWLSTLFPALVGGAIGGAWGSGSLAYRIGAGNPYLFTGLTALLFPLAAELLFRGLIFGNLAARLPIQKNGGPWWSSWPTLITTMLYATGSILMFLTVARGGSQLSQSFLIVVGAVIFGISSGIARERSESVLPCVLLHWVCAATLLLFGRLFL